MSQYPNEPDYGGGESPGTSYDGGGAGQQRMTPSFGLPPLTPMVKRLMIINVSVYAVFVLLDLFAAPMRDLVTNVFVLDGGVWASFFPFVPFWQLLSYGFLHHPAPSHILFNMLGLYFFGTMVESTVGPRRFLTTYLLALVIGGLAFIVLGALLGKEWSVVGASGAVLAMIVAAATMRPNAQVIFIMFPIKLKWLAGLIVAMDLINGAYSLKLGAVDGGTAHVVHLAGAAFGFLAVRRRWIWADPMQRIQARRSIAHEEQRQSNERRMDSLLQKIHREGIQSLTRSERTFLKRTSSRRDSA